MQQKPETSFVLPTGILRQVPKVNYPEYKKADSLYKELNLKEALQEYSDAYNNLPDAADLTKKQYGLFNIGFCTYRLYEFEKARAILKKGLKNFEKAEMESHPLVTDFYIYLAKSYYFLYKTDSALLFLRKAEQLELGRKVVDYHKLGDIYNGLGDVNLYHLKDMMKAEKFYHKCRSIFERLENADKEYLLDTYYKLSENYKLKKDFEKALNYSLKSLNLARLSPGLERTWVPYAYNQIARIYQNKDEHEKAIQYFQKGLDFVKQRDPDALFGFYYNDMGNAYFLLKEYKKAKINFETTLRLNRKSKDKREKLYACLGLGVLYPELGKLDSSEYYFSETLQLIKEVFGDPNPSMTYCYLKYGNVYKNMNRYDSALILYQQGLIHGMNNFDNLDVSSNPTAKQVLRNPNFFNTILQKAAVFNEKYDLTKERSYLFTSLNCYDLLDSVLNIQKRLYNDDFSEMISNESSKDIYEEAINVCLTLYKKENERKYVERALKYMEKSRANVLRENLKSIEANAKVGLPDSLIEQERFLKSELAFFKSKWIEHEEKVDIEKEELNKIQDQIFATSRKLEELKNKIVAQNPAYYNIKYESSSVSVTELLNYSVKNNTILIEYFAGKRSIYVVSINPDTVAFEQISNIDQIENALFRFQSNISDTFRGSLQENYVEIKDAGHFLFSTLVKPFIGYSFKKDKLKNNLIIIPDENLSAIPFEALATEHSNNPVVDFKNLPYLIKEFNIRYSYSLNIFFLPKINQDEPEKTLIGFDYFTEGNTKSAIPNFSQLQGTSMELNAIKEVIQTGHFYKGEKATEDNFKANAPKANIIHLAVHGVADTLNPFNSRLYFNKSPMREDGILFFHELYNLKTNARLVVLSACETGIGRQQRGEGVLSLGRAFQYSGASSLIMSLWKISDKESASLIGDFYENLMEEDIISSSLSKAKLKFLENADEITAHPKNWAGLVVYGNFEDDVNFDSYNKYYWLATGIVVMAILLLLLYKKKDRLYLSLNKSLLR